MTKLSDEEQAELAALIEPLRRVHAHIRERVFAACEAGTVDRLSAVAGDEADTIYAVDCIAEEALLTGVEREIAPIAPVAVVAEGLGERAVVLPSGTPLERARWRLLVDPIDGTRGLMFQKRPAWVLTAVAPARLPQPTLADVELAMQSEIPLAKQHLCDVVWALRGGGAEARRVDRLSGQERRVALRPSRAESIEHGFATFVRFFPGARGELAAVDEQVMHRLLGAPPSGRAMTFEDQYISTGGQLYELMCGHDRFVADLRPLVSKARQSRGEPAVSASHPYDICTALCAREAGVVLTDARGQPLDAPLDLETDVAWIGYANETLRRAIEPVLMAVLAERGLLASA